MYSHELDPLARAALNAWIAVRALGFPATALSMKTFSDGEDRTILALHVQDGDTGVDLLIGKFSAMWTDDEIIDDFHQALKIYSSGQLVDAAQMVARFGGLDMEQWTELTKKAKMATVGPELRN